MDPFASAMESWIYANLGIGELAAAVIMVIFFTLSEAVKRFVRDVAA